MIDCWELVDVDGFKRMVEAGWIVTTLPEGAQVDIGPLAHFTAMHVQSWLPEREFVKEVLDVLEQLNGRPTSTDRCRDAYARFEEEPTAEARDALKEAYEAVPEHLRGSVLGDMDVKDIPIRMIIYGEDEIKRWPHWALAHALGHDPLPYIDVPRVPDKRGSS